VNATKGHGSSWQQGVTFVVVKNDDDTFENTMAWRELGDVGAA